MGISKVELLKECRKNGAQWNIERHGARWAWPWYRMRCGDFAIAWGEAAVLATRKAMGRENQSAGRQILLSETIYDASGQIGCVVTRLSEELELRYAKYGRRRAVRLAIGKARRRITETERDKVQRAYEPWGRGKPVGDSEV